MIKPPSLPADSSAHPLSPEFLHDLRTPLNLIIGYSEMLTGQAQDEGQLGFLSDLQKIHTAGWQLLALLNNGMPSLPDEIPNVTRLTAKALLDIPHHELLSELAAEQALPNVSPARILVVDDNPLNREVLTLRLKKQGHDVVIAENGRQGLEAVRSQAFDLILLDLLMPEMDGYTVLREIKADKALQHIPVVIISALDETESAVRCIEIGAEDYLPLPFDPILLKARIGSCLDKKRAHDREMRLFQRLQQNYKRLQKLEKLRENLTHMIIHDLRTPLSSVMLGIEALEGAGELNGIQREIIDISRGGGEALLSMINGLLDVEKLESGTMRLDSVVIGVAALIAPAVSQVAPLAEAKSLTLIQQIPGNLPPLQGDEDKLVRTLVNLLGNAIKFTPPGGTITVEVVHNEIEQTVVFTISDTGEGIPAGEFGRIFEKFGQVESRQGGRVMSTGLGLTFCKLAVEAHGGHIGVKSVLGQGSQFHFTLPLSTRENEVSM